MYLYLVKFSCNRLEGEFTLSSSFKIEYASDIDEIKDSIKQELIPKGFPVNEPSKNISIDMIYPLKGKKRPK